MAQIKCKLSSLLLPIFILFLQSFVLPSCCLLQAASPPGVAASWAHAVDLNEDFRILWTITNEDATFEIQARTKGYVGFGFSVDGNQEGADIAIGWVDRGHTFFQDRHVAVSGTSEALVDPSQDYILLMGYENATHTVIRFRRKLDTCDSAHDIPITNDTMRVMYLYSNVDPLNSSSSVSVLPNLSEAWRPYKSLLMTNEPEAEMPPAERAMEWRNVNAELPYGDDTMFWCKIFTLNNIEKKLHIIRYEPIFDSSWSMFYLQQITLYQCDGNLDPEAMAYKSGQQCSSIQSTQLACNTYVAAWSRGSKGFTFPPDTGYPIDTNEARYFLMETHYNNLNVGYEPLRSNVITDNSGLKLHITERLRPFDAGVLSVGMDPNWHHIIPPGQKRVVSEGHCMGDCTAYAFPPKGINIFAILMRTHQLAKAMKLRQVRKGQELAPISYDKNIDPMYQEFRRLRPPVQSMPGDRLLTECVYDSSSRSAITLGGLSMKEESCTVLVLYFPRQKKLTSCHSIPSLSTVLHSLGIAYLVPNSNPVLISSPSELKGMTLETRLLTSDWGKLFKRFQEITSKGNFKPICRGATGQILPSFENLVGFPVNITKLYNERNRCLSKRLATTELSSESKLPILGGVASNDIIQAVVRSSRSSQAETLALSGLSSSAQHANIFFHLWYVTIGALIVTLS